MDVKTIFLIAGFGIILMFITAKVLATPLKISLRVLFNTLFGLCSLFLVNTTTAFTGLHLGINLFNAVVVGLLGVPGLGLLFLIQWVLRT
ncbi:MAG: pro-sigmaK processing inhibitor BofA family protein [Oscillospiraceae bacterium]|nr:pro-sigmaK processing inhibitor BofA family protein [Oscillospiraceae bacterium]